MRKAGDRLLRALVEEFQEADAPFGCNSALPLNNFQVIMADYDLPLIRDDLTDLEKRGYVHKDDADQRYVDYASIMHDVKPKQRSMAETTSLFLRSVLRIQKAWRRL